MKGPRRYLRMMVKLLKSCLGWQVSLDDLSLKEARVILPRCKRINLNDTDRFRVQQLRVMASEMGYDIMSTGEVTPA